MDLILKVRTGRNRAILTCEGQLIAGKECDEFRRSALLLMGGFDMLILDLGGLRSADMTGLRGLAWVLETAEKQGKQVRIAHAGSWMIAKLEAVGLARFVKNSIREAAHTLPRPAQALA
jgi:hypothetical protein